MNKEPAINLESTLLRDPNHVSGELDGEIVLLGLGQGKYYHLEEVAQRIWEIIETPTRVSDLMESILAEYAVEPRRCEVEVFAFLEELRREGLLRVLPEKPSG